MTYDSILWIYFILILSKRIRQFEN